jgi:hypothetical protein
MIIRENISRKADLHIHTTFSDSTLTPQAVIEKVEQSGLSCIAITDHDTVDGIIPVLEEAKSKNIELIPGVELTAEVANTEIHILGYFIDFKKDWFKEKLAYLREMRRKRFVKMVEKLKNHGIYLNSEEIMNKKDYTSIGRPHLAQELVKKGYVDSIKEAFKLYIGNGKPCHVKKEMLLPQEAISMIEKLGGISVLAHPYLMRNDNLIPLLVKEGLDGIEVYHPEQSSYEEKKYLRLAKEYNLLITGGSDCHGLGKERILIGTVKIPYKFVEEMKRYKDGRQAS